MLLALSLCLPAAAQESGLKPGRMVTQYAVTSDNDYQSNDPKDWQLLGSNDNGTNWTLLDKQTDQAFAERSQRRVFGVSNRVAYNTYRLLVTRAAGSTEQLEIAEIELMGPVVGVTNESALGMEVTASLDHPLMGPAFQAFDGDPGTKWWDFGLEQSKEAWIQCQYTLHSEEIITNVGQLILTVRRTAISNPLNIKASVILSNLTAQTADTTRVLTGYALTSADDMPGRDPRDWRLLGSRDGEKTWDVLDSRLNEVFGGRFEKRTFTLTTPAAYPIYRLQIDAVADPGGQLTDSIHIAEIEPLYSAKETNVAAFGMVVSAQGEHPPLEMVEKAFDGSPGTKWLDFSNGRANRSSWIQWQYVKGMDGMVVNLNHLRTASHESTRAVSLNLNGVLIYTNAGNEVGILDETGYELIRLKSPVQGGRFGDLINLKGGFEFANQQWLISNPILVSLGELPRLVEVHPGQIMSDDAHFLLTATRGRADRVFLGDSYSTIQLTSEDGREHLLAKIPNPGHAPLGDLSGCRLQVRGVAEPVFNQKGQRVAGIIWASGFDQVNLMPQTDQEWAGWPEYAITNLTQAGAPWGTLVRVRGKNGGQKSGHRWVVSQGASQLAVDFDIPADLPMGAPIECAGLLSNEGAAPVLRMACFRPPTDNRVSSPDPELIFDNGGRPITGMHQLLDLTTRHPDKTYAVKVRGIITYIDSRLGGFYLQDGPDGVQVDAQMQAGLSAVVRQEGMYVELTGIATGDWIRPADFVKFLGRGTMPEPKRPSWDELLTGKDDDHWVEIKGVVTDVGAQLTVMVDGREMKVWIDKMDKKARQNLLGSVVRIQGVCAGVFNTRNMRLGERLLVSSDENIEVLRAAPANPLDLPTVPVGQLMQSPSDYAEQTIQFIKTSGMVTYKDADQLFVQDGDAGVRVVLRKDAEVAPGDLVEVAGLGKADGLSPKLVQAIIRKVGQASLPVCKEMDLFAVGSGIQENLDAARVCMEATFLGSSFNGNAQILEMQHDNPKRLFYAYLPTKLDSRLPFEVGSKVKLVGVFKAKTEEALDYGQLTTSFEVFLNASSDVTVLVRPPWWTAQHAFWIFGGLLAVLILALAWAGVLRKQVRARTSELSREIEGHELTEGRLQNEIGERKRMQEQVEKTHKELMIASRQAGMAEVATNVLHDVGNTLNSVNISTTIIGDTVRKAESGNLSRAVSMMRDHLPDISTFLHHDPKGKLILDYVDRLAAHLKSQQMRALEEVQNLRKNVEHIKSVVSMQQGYAKVAGVIETFRVTEVMEDAMKMNEETLENHHLKVVRDYDPAPLMVSTDRHKVLQVLINLIQNARQACDESTSNGKCITLRIAGGDGMALISVTDDGVGVTPENRERIFNHGFTTRKNGHGFGLHSSALTAKEMGGDLQFQSDGPGKGATFTLLLPLDKKLSPPTQKHVPVSL